MERHCPLQSCSCWKEELVLFLPKTVLSFLPPQSNTTSCCVASTLSLCPVLFLKANCPLSVQPLLTTGLFPHLHLLSLPLQNCLTLLHRATSDFFVTPRVLLSCPSSFPPVSLTLCSLLQKFSLAPPTSLSGGQGREKGRLCVSHFLSALCPVSPFEHVFSNTGPPPLKTAPWERAI